MTGRRLRTRPWAVTGHLQGHSKIFFITKLLLTFIANNKSSKMGKQQAFVFLKDPENAWIPAKLTHSSGNVADVQIPEYADEQSTICDGGKTAKKWIEAEVDLSDYGKGVLPMQNVDEHGNMTCFADMVELPFLHEVSSAR
jgi:hypothetical protein